MKRSQMLGTLAAATVMPRIGGAADLPPLRVGWVASFSGGLFELAGKACDAALAAFFKEHGDTIAGRKIEILKRDDGGVAPETSKRLAQELVVSNQVDFLMGLTVSPNAMGVGAVSTQAKVPLFITNASALGILEHNPYAARFSFSEGNSPIRSRAGPSRTISRPRIRSCWISIRASTPQRASRPPSPRPAARCWVKSACRSMPTTTRPTFNAFAMQSRKQSSRFSPPSVTRFSKRGRRRVAIAAPSSCLRPAI
jgi:hypothetical protein